MIRQGRGLINHFEFSTYKHGGLKLPVRRRAGHPQKLCMWSLLLQRCYDKKGNFFLAACKISMLSIRNPFHLWCDEKAKGRSEKYKGIEGITENTGRIWETTSFQRAKTNINKKIEEVKKGSSLKRRKESC